MVDFGKEQFYNIWHIWNASEILLRGILTTRLKQRLKEKSPLFNITFQIIVEEVYLTLTLAARITLNDRLTISIISAKKELLDNLIPLLGKYDT